MGTSELLKEINRLPLKRRKEIADKILLSINKEDEKKMLKAVNEMAVEYKTNTDLTAFTAIDFANFYEAR